MNSDSNYALPVSTDDSLRRLASSWLILALCALVGSGLVVILVVLARTPVIHDLIPWTGSFRTALVIHVDLSVLVWFLSITALMASLTVSSNLVKLGQFSFTSAATGVLILTLSPFLGVDAPFMNNYVPVLDNSSFRTGLFMFMFGVTGMTLYGLVGADKPAYMPATERSLRFGVRSALAIILVTLAVWVYTFFAIPDPLSQDSRNREYYYEVLYWGSGHVLQFVHTQMVMVVWLWLASYGNRKIALSARLVHLLLILGAVPVAAVLSIHTNYSVDSPDLRLAYTWLMQWGGGLAAVPMGIALGYSLWRQRQPSTRSEPSLQHTALLLSLLMFAVGGAIGFMIHEINVTIPSHYHGSIVSITLAYMGIVYHVLPLLGYGSVHARWAVWQLYLYAVGSLLHVGGLAWSGMLGIQRKTAGAEQGLQTLDKQLAMGLTGLGGMVAVVGGILFLVLTLKALRQERSVA
ncbi:MAG: cbb3-type cytochrome c oxidase subunit I [Magnetococcales bacterium]|nr:cbb3-type cytochrome c oxidase subunit I [Magnetococcales bacterium]